MTVKRRIALLIPCILSGGVAFAMLSGRVPVNRHWIDIGAACNILMLVALATVKLFPKK
jgi:hypothetical protein